MTITVLAASVYEVHAFVRAFVLRPAAAAGVSGAAPPVRAALGEVKTMFGGKH